MRPTDLLILPVAALWQQKLRTLLTTLGVVFGAFVLAASLSIGEGVQETIDRESHRSDISRRVEVYPHWNVPASESEIEEVKVEGTMTQERRERLRKALAAQKQRSILSFARRGLSQEGLAKLAALPHVESLVPMVYNSTFAMLGTKSELADLSSVRPEDEDCRRRIVAGRFFDKVDQRGVVVSEFLAYRLGVVDDKDLEALIGKPLRVEFREQKVEPGFVVYIMKPGSRVSREELAALDKVRAKLPEALDKLDLSKAEADVLRQSLQGRPATKEEVFTEELTIVGVIRPRTAEDERVPYDALRVDSDLLVPYQTAMDLYFRTPDHQEVGLNNAVLLVDTEKNVKDVVAQVAKLGFESRAAIEFIEREQFIYLLIFGGMTCVAGVALLVSALGIANTMLMSVLERTREIGIMKAVGADNRQLQFIFLFEGALIGLFGALLGLLLAWGASFPADSWVRSMVMRDIKIDLKGSIFVFPTWISLTVLIFTVLVTTLAALYPARHASRIDPVKALRHE